MEAAIRYVAPLYPTARGRSQGDFADGQLRRTSTLEAACRMSDRLAPLTVGVLTSDHFARALVNSIVPSSSIWSFATSDELLRSTFFDRAGCLVLDASMPYPGGLAVQEQLLARGINRSIVYVATHCDVRTCVEVMRAGALDYLTKPISPATLLKAVQEASKQDHLRLQHARAAKEIAVKVARLTFREKQVMAGIARGLLNKQIAFELGLSEVTVKVHRGHLMRKLDAKSVPDLIRTWDAAQLILERGVMPCRHSIMEQ